MKKAINVLKQFVLTLEDGTTHSFQAGVQEIDAKLHEHWYVRAHSEPVEAPASAGQPEAPVVEAPAPVAPKAKK